MNALFSLNERPLLVQYFAFALITMLRRLLKIQFNNKQIS